MPLFMDIHKVEGELSPDDIVEAHRRDLETQQQYGVEYQRYWVDAEKGRVFCLVEAPSAEAAERVHREAHGMVADEIYEVREGV